MDRDDNAVPSRAEPAARRPFTRQMRALRPARSCYDHLAGQLGVAVTQALLARDLIRPGDKGHYEVTQAGRDWFASVGVDVRALKPTARGLARPCLDWTERTPHLAGPLGNGLLAALCARDWLRRAEGTRAVEITPAGVAALREILGVEAAA